MISLKLFFLVLIPGLLEAAEGDTAFCPETLKVGDVETFTDTEEKSPNTITVLTNYVFPFKARINSISLYGMNTDNQVTFQIYRPQGEVSDCRLELIASWEAPAFSSTGWQTVSVPRDAGLIGEEGDIFGWFDNVPSGGVVPFSLGDNYAVCTKGRLGMPNIGDTVQLISSNSDLLGNRQYAISLCYGDASCPASLEDGPVETFTDLHETSANTLTVLTNYVFPVKARINSVSVYVKNTGSQVILQIYRAQGDVADCNLDLITAWEVPAITREGWQTISIPSDVSLIAEEGDMFGWFDSVSNGGTVGLNMGDTYDVCTKGRLPTPNVGDTVQLYPTNYKGRNRDYAVSVCYTEISE